MAMLSAHIDRCMIALSKTAASASGKEKDVASLSLEIDRRESEIKKELVEELQVFDADKLHYFHYFGAEPSCPGTHWNLNGVDGAVVLSRFSGMDSMYRISFPVEAIQLVCRILHSLLNELDESPLKRGLNNPLSTERIRSLLNATAKLAAHYVSRVDLREWSVLAGEFISDAQRFDQWLPTSRQDNSLTVNDIEAASHRKIADLAAKWLSNIEQMTSDLATVLEDYLQGYEFDDGPDGIVIFRPRADLGERSLVFAGYVLGNLRGALHLVNSHRPDIPFPESILGNLFLTSWECSSWESDEVFTKSVYDYMGQLDILASYQQMIHVLSNQEVTAESETHSKVERMASIRAIMEQNPTWVNGKRQLILDELKRREKAKGIRRPGIRKNTGLKIIEQIISEQD